MIKPLPAIGDKVLLRNKYKDSSFTVAKQGYYPVCYVHPKGYYVQVLVHRQLGTTRETIMRQDFCDKYKLEHKSIRQQ